jgi:DNA-nicking Smr family endonuclease
VSRRKLSQEEAALWRRVAERTDRLSSRQVFDPDTYLPDAWPETKSAGAKAPHFPPRPTPRQPGHDLAPSLHDRLRKAPVQMDQKAFGKLKRGKLVPEGKLDLHGMTMDRAHPALTRFILSAHASGKRLVLVITGKGKDRDEGGPIPIRYGVLRHQVPNWLSHAPLRSLVLQVTQAHISHGGSGAYYVYLRRQR